MAAAGWLGAEMIPPVETGFAAAWDSPSHARYQLPDICDDLGIELTRRA